MNYVLCYIDHDGFIKRIYLILCKGDRCVEAYIKRGKLNAHKHIWYAPVPLSEVISHDR